MNTKRVFSAIYLPTPAPSSSPNILFVKYRLVIDLSRRLSCPKNSDIPTVQMFQQFRCPNNSSSRLGLSSGHRVEGQCEDFAHQRVRLDKPRCQASRFSYQSDSYYIIVADGLTIRQGWKRNALHSHLEDALSRPSSLPLGSSLAGLTGYAQTELGSLLTSPTLHHSGQAEADGSTTRVSSLLRPAGRASRHYLIMALSGYRSWGRSLTYPIRHRSAGGWSGSLPGIVGLRR